MQEFIQKIDQTTENIWRYESFLEESFEPSEKLFLQETFTPFEKSNYLENVDLFLKREDKSITGSLKCRGLAYQLSVAMRKGESKFVISTTGNAGITLQKFLEKYSGEVIVITAKNIHSKKINVLKKVCPNLLFAKNPPHIANFISNKYGYKNFRPSKDDTSIPGYLSLGFEIFEQVKGKLPANIFTYVTSGSSFIGLYQSFLKLKELNLISALPRMYAVRADHVTTYRDNEVKKITEETSGEIITVSQKEYDNERFDTSYEGRSTIFAVRKLMPKGSVLAILTGEKYTEEETNQEIPEIITLSDVERYMEKFEK